MKSIVKVIVVSFFPGNGTNGGPGGFDWYLDVPEVAAQVRERVIDLLTGPDGVALPTVSVTICRLDAPVDSGLRGWQDAVTQWLDENAELRELPDQGAASAGLDGAQDSQSSKAEANARGDYRTFLGQEIVADALHGNGGLGDLHGKFRVCVCQTEDDDIARVMDGRIDPIWNVELLEVLEGDQKAVWRTENLYYCAPSYLSSTGDFASDRDREQYRRLTTQLKKEAK